jgi:DNA invertase Pin-like site-specific DNA recombinase
MQTSKRPVAIAYYRVSTEKQGRSGLGLADQERAIRTFCEQRALVLEGEFTEVESGKNDARPQLALALARARRKGGLLVIATLSRLGRRVSFVSSLMEQGVPFACADGPDDTPFILHVKAAFAEEEARKIRERTKAALAMAKARGVKLGIARNLTQDARRKGGEVMRARAAAEHAAKLPAIMAARAEGLSLRATAERIGVSPMYVSRLLNRDAAALL